MTRRPHLVLAILVLSCLVGAGWAAPPAAAAKELKRVLVLFSEDETHPAHELTQQGIREVFAASELFDVLVYTEYLDEARFDRPSQAQIFADYLRQKYAGKELHAVITVYPLALDFLIAERATLFPRVPIVAAELTSVTAERLEQSPARGFVTATVLGDNAAAVIDTMLRLRPETRRVALVSGTSVNDVYGESVLRGGLRPYAGKLEVIDLTKLSMEETLSRVGSLPADAAVLYESMLRDAAGQDFVPREALSLVSRASKVPVFGVYGSYLGFGIVGGPLVSFEQQGRGAAALALRVLEGEDPMAIPFWGRQAYANAYDWRELKRWNISEKMLPPGSEIRYRVPTFWEEHWAATLGTVSAFLGETLLVVGLLANIQRRRRTQRSLRESEERVRLAVWAARTGLWSMDADSGDIWATGQTRELFGFGLDEALDWEKMLAAVHPADRSHVRLAIERARDLGEEVSLECRLALPDGNVRSVIVRGRLQQNGSGKRTRIMGACADITARKLAEESLRERENELRVLAGRLINNQEEELRRLARELHDDLTQKLAVLAIDAGVLERTMKSEPTAASEALKGLKENLIEVSNEVHNLSRQLHPSILDDLGLLRASEAECDAFFRRTGIDVAFESGNVPRVLPDGVALCLYRVLQEALRNVEKHSKAGEVHVALEGLPQGVALSIRDSGIGFDGRPGERRQGVGLSSMKERVRLVNGTLSTVSEPGRGTEIQVTVPVGERSNAETADTDR